MSGIFESINYVPGVSGYRIDYTKGVLEMNPCTIGSAANAPERQMVSVEVASYSKYDLPKNAGELLAFMQAELQKVPDEYRASAEFEGFDASYGDELFEHRLFLSYSRLETEEELADRLEKASLPGTSLTLDGRVLTISRGGSASVVIGDVGAAKPALYSIKTQLREGGKRVVAGIEMAAPTDAQFADEVRAVIRTELRLGGMLHR